MTHTDAILDFASAPHVLPPQVRADAERLLADTLAVGAAGAASPEALKLRSAIHNWGTGIESRLFSGSRSTAQNAAFFNGFAIHCLEWDAVHEPAVVHALSVVTAALLASSDRLGGTDPDTFLTAVAVGVDIASGLGLSATGPMRFFRPATAGVIGAALAVARLEGLSSAQFSDVLGLAYSFASGTMQAHVEASIALPLQIGNAARAAINAIDLVQAGLEGPHDVLEGSFGYSKLIENVDISSYIQHLGTVWRISEVSIKPYPSGRASHGALGVLVSPYVTLSDVDRIVLHAPPLIHRLVGRPYMAGAPMSYNRLCLAFLVPLILRDGHIDPRLTTTEADLAARVSVILDDNADTNAMSPQRLVVTLKDGQVIEHHIPANPGSPAAPLTPAQATTKYDLCRTLAPDTDPLIFDAPLAFATDPQ